MYIVEEFESEHDDKKKLLKAWLQFFGKELQRSENWQKKTLSKALERGIHWCILIQILTQHLVYDPNTLRNLPHLSIAP